MLSIYRATTYTDFYALGPISFAESTNDFKCTAACQANEKIRSVLSAVPDKISA